MGSNPTSTAHTGEISPNRTLLDHVVVVLPHRGRSHRATGSSPGHRVSGSTLLPDQATPPGAASRASSRAQDCGGVQASLVALRLAAVGKPVSRRALRNGGVTGSNERLNALAPQLNAEFAGKQAAVP